MKTMTQNLTYIACAILLMAFTSTQTIAQSGTWKYGFELGWSGSKLLGDSEMTSSGEELETTKLNSGFHLSFYSRRFFTDNFGLQFGLAYGQRGGQNEFVGPSYYIFGLASDQPRLVASHRVESRKYNNSYIDLPVVAFHRFGRVLEIGVGAYASFLIASKSEGEIQINDDGSAISFQPFFLDTDYNFLRDDYGDASMGMQTIRIEGQDFTEPRIIPAYYEYLEDPGEKLFNRFDYGLLAHIGVYFNESLNLKGRVLYGLSDLTIEEADVAKGSFTEDRQLIFRDDTDRSLSYQISLGFLF